jgi:hypothetical protein
MDRVPNVVLRFLDPWLASRTWFGEEDLDDVLMDVAPVPPALERHLRSCARLSAGQHRARREIRDRVRPDRKAHQEILRLLAAPYFDKPGYRPSWQPDARPVPPATAADPIAEVLVRQWDEEDALARAAAREVGDLFTWREIDTQDGHGIVLDGSGRNVFGLGLYPEPGRGIAHHSPGRVRRDVAARRGMLARLDPSAEADRVILELLAAAGTP